ncbi:type I restriction-modification system subunit M [Micrococcus lylae]|uniref:type I restriction-modification system subunit M n=1 Tax=Micrococcus lylae TaxID=1273 RepID=UPI0021A61D3E|nr:class I SAM-dependent DNA methyltransferase [Micrococcus lylae]MCT2008215.1 type I restriction-modification system subunit M [Micrococcus lylae]MCT2072122.1 type I restriction-modification system subunit M [Micrococcus lylae]
MPSPQNLSNFVWGIADQLRGVFKPNQYGTLVLPMTILRRMEAVMAPHRQFFAELAAKGHPDFVLENLVESRTGLTFYNLSPFTLDRILQEPDLLRTNLLTYVDGFSQNVADLFTYYEFDKTAAKLDEHDRLFLVLQQFASIDLSPDTVSNAEMGTLFEDLIRRFAAASNETAGEHFTPRDAVKLLVDLLTANDDDVLTGYPVRTVYDPTAGTGGMLSLLDERLRRMNPNAEVRLFGQELNDQSYAICKSELLGKGQDADGIARGDTLKNDAHLTERFDYVLSNPPYGGDWKASRAAVEKEIAAGGATNRFPGGAPAISDGQMLFLQLVASKLRPVSEGGGRAGIVLNGSPLFTGGAGSGPSEIRRWLLESDLVDAIVALPTDMFYNTGIATYVWVLDNNKPAERRGKVQLIDARTFFTKLRRNVGSKNKELSKADRQRVLDIYRDFNAQSEANAEFSKVLTAQDFGYREITVERPLQLRFEVEDATIAAALATKPVAKLPDDGRSALEAALASLRDRDWDHQPTFVLDLKKALQEHGVTAGAPLVKALTGAIGVHDPEAEVVKNKKGEPEPDTSLRDTELVPFGRDIHEYFEAEVAPHVPGAWIDESKTKTGYEIPFTRLFYTYVPPRPLEEIDAELKQLTAEIIELLQEVER